MRDTIYRDDAIQVAIGYCHPANVAKELAKLPSAQKTQLSEEGTTSDCISRQAAIQMLNTLDRYVANSLRLCDTDKTFPQNEVFIVDDMYESLEQLPSAQPERKPGHWEMLSEQSARCTACGAIRYTNGRDKTGKGYIFYENFKFCPECGSKMEVEHD